MQRRNGRSGFLGFAARGGRGGVAWGRFARVGRVAGSRRLVSTRRRSGRGGAPRFCCPWWSLRRSVGGRFAPVRQTSEILAARLHAAAQRSQRVAPALLPVAGAAAWRGDASPGAAGWQDLGGPTPRGGAADAAGLLGFAALGGRCGVAWGGGLPRSVRPARSWRLDSTQRRNGRSGLLGFAARGGRCGVAWGHFARGGRVARSWRPDSSAAARRTRRGSSVLLPLVVAAA